MNWIIDKIFELRLVNEWIIVIAGTVVWFGILILFIELTTGGQA